MTTSRDYRSTTGAYHQRGWVELRGPLGPAAVATAADKLSRRPTAKLLVAGVQDTDLGFLVDLPPVQELQVVLSGVRDVQALVHHAGSLRRLHLELGRHPVAVDALGDLPRLRELYLRKDGPAAVRGAPGAVARARALEHLALHGVTLPTVAPLTALPRLRGLALKLGGAPDLVSLPELPVLRSFEAWRVRGIADLSPLAASGTLEVLWLESLGRAALPGFSGAASLSHVRIDALPLREGLAGLAAAPALRQLHITRRSFDVEEVAVLRDHPTLEAAFIPLRGRAPEEEVRLGLAPVHHAPFVAFGAGAMGLPPDGWNGEYLAPRGEPHASASGGAPVPQPLRDT